MGDTDTIQAEELQELIDDDMRWLFKRDRPTGWAAQRMWACRDQIVDALARLQELEAAARHQPVEVWAERPGEFSWKCMCGALMKHQPLSRFSRNTTAFVCVDQRGPSGV